MTQTSDTHDLTAIVPTESKLVTLGTGYEFTEGPVWDSTDKVLYFSDMPGDTRRRMDSTGEIDIVRRPSNKCNGMAYDGRGRLLVCEHATSSLVREDRDGTRTVLATHWDGKELNSPNDVIATSNGDVYFTDPSYGRLPGFGVEREQDLTFQGLYRIPAGDGELELIADDFGQPNGLCTSPDETLLYVNDTERAHIRVYDLDANGVRGDSRIFAENIGDGVIENGVVDGMKCDADGNVWVTGPGGIWVFSPDATHLGTVAVPENVGNFTFGGDDWSTLFIAASTSLYSLETNARSAPVPNVVRGA